MVLAAPGRPATAAPARDPRSAPRRRPAAAPAPAGLSSRTVFVTCDRLRPMRPASSSCVVPNSSSSWRYAAASSSGFSWTRCRFSSSASRSIASSAVLRTMAGMVSSPRSRVARQRRSPMTSSYVPGEVSRTTTGCSRPNSRIEALSSSSASSSKTCRGCLAFARIASTGNLAERGTRHLGRRRTAVRRVRGVRDARCRQGREVRQGPPGRQPAPVGERSGISAPSPLPSPPRPAHANPPGEPRRNEPARARERTAVGQNRAAHSVPSTPRGASRVPRSAISRAASK